MLMTSRGKSSCSSTVAVDQLLSSRSISYNLQLLSATVVFVFQRDLGQYWISCVVIFSDKLVVCWAERIKSHLAIMEIYNIYMFLMVIRSISPSKVRYRLPESLLEVA